MKRLVSALLALLILLGVFSTVGAEGPVVKFDKKVIVSFQGREVAVSFYLQNPKRYKEAMNAQLVDEEGTVVAETTLVFKVQAEACLYRSDTRLAKSACPYW